MILKYSNGNTIQDPALLLRSSELTIQIYSPSFPGFGVEEWGYLFMVAEGNSRDSIFVVHNVCVVHNVGL